MLFPVPHFKNNLQVSHLHYTTGEVQLQQIRQICVFKKIDEDNENYANVKRISEVSLKV